MPSKDELDAVAEHYGNDAGARVNVSRALGERENDVAYGHDTSAADKVLNQYRWPPKQERDPAKAAQARTAAADGDEQAKSRAPAARQSRPAAKTGGE